MPSNPHWVVMHYREYDVDTIVEAVTHSSEEAERVLAELINRLTHDENVPRLSKQHEDATGYPVWTIYRAEYADTEPTDDERHHQLWIQSV